MRDLRTCHPRRTTGYSVACPQMLCFQWSLGALAECRWIEKRFYIFAVCSNSKVFVVVEFDWYSEVSESAPLAAWTLVLYRLHHFTTGCRFAINPPAIVSSLRLPFYPLFQECKSPLGFSLEIQIAAISFVHLETQRKVDEYPLPTRSVGSSIVYCITSQSASWSILGKRFLMRTNAWFVNCLGLPICLMSGVKI